ncbi:tryptophan synthase subunit beta like protein [Halomonas sp. A40-4]|uniref:tryptophan synthase subunit beta like protein n=1 Tax=Halomonas sp. A40-4 TaxID=2785909 RepID=UPI0018EFA8EA|nr:tryptophan synthase subunit beta like protein [Halomonas sp. A40-4]QPL47198.1 tryptophan synthase subunit beta like protein [Halomonas sp. A40-4]
MYVNRDKQGEISQVSRTVSEHCKEYVSPESAELQRFINAETHEAALLRQSDMEFVRVLEDVITLLMDRGIIRFTDLPEKAQEKLLDRQSLRKRVNDVGLISDDDSDVI